MTATVSILDQILADTRALVAKRKALVTETALEARPAFHAPTLSLARALRRPDGPAFVAECKRASPSEGLLRQEYDPAANQWRTLAPMPTPRHGFYGVGIRRGRLGEILLAGGAPAAGLSVSRANEAFFFAAAAAPAFSAQTLVDAASFRPLLAPGCCFCRPPWLR